MDRISSEAPQAVCLSCIADSDFNMSIVCPGSDPDLPFVFNGLGGIDQIHNICLFYLDSLQYRCHVNKGFSRVSRPL